MSSLAIFRNSLVTTLQCSISINLDKYLSNEVWITDISTHKKNVIKTDVEFVEPLILDLPDNDNLKDIENAIRFHKALRHLTPLQARDPRLWTKLTHVDFWPYMRVRWPVERHMPIRDRATRFIESRYFVAQNQSRSLLRNGIARLWWTAQLSHDPNRDNPYELTRVLLSTLDITQQIVERGIGRASNIIKGFLEFLLRNKNLLLTGGDKNRIRIRRLAKHLNMTGGVCILDLLSQGEVMDLLNKELTRILESETTVRNQGNQK